MRRRGLTRERLALIRRYSMQRRWNEPAQYAGEWLEWVEKQPATPFTSTDADLGPPLPAGARFIEAWGFPA